MKVLSAVLLSSLLAASGMAAAANDNPTVAKRSVSYQCQQGKKIKVTYGFNKQGLPTYAAFTVKGKKRVLPINLDRSDIAGTMFGKEGGYTASTDYLDRKSYRKSPFMLTAPDNEILYKNCSAR